MSAVLTPRRYRAARTSPATDASTGAALAFAEFVRQTETRTPGLMDFEHVPRMVAVLQKVADTFDPDGGLSFDEAWQWQGPGTPNYKRVMFLMPPRYFKSECTSRRFPAYFLHRFPHLHFGLASYGASLAWELSEEARTYYEIAGGTVSRDTSAKRRWRTSAGGEMWADGTGGSLLGRGYHCGAVDDPIDPLDVDSLAYQQRFESWWPSKWDSRSEPFAAMIMTMQRLGVWDPVGWLWAKEYENPQHWHVVCFDEIKSSEPLADYDGPMGLPETCTLEADPRADGELLAPSRFSRAEVDRKQLSVVSSAQRQQRPQALKGEFWLREWFDQKALIYDKLPEDVTGLGDDWDTAYTDNDANAASARVRTARGPDRFVEVEGSRENWFYIYIEDVDWNWYEEPELIDWMKAAPGPHHIEQKATGKSAKSHLDRAGIAASEVPVVGGNKMQRSDGVRHIARDGRVRVRRSVLEKLLEGERQGLLRVTKQKLTKGGPDLDLNDAFVQAINRHTKKRTETTIGGMMMNL